MMVCKVDAKTVIWAEARIKAFAELFSKSGADEVVKSRMYLGEREKTELMVQLRFWGH